MRNLPPLGALRAFEAAARRRSFKDAATELGVTPTAVSHQIRQLEETLGVALFARGPRKVALTAKGEALYPTLRRSFDDISEAVAAARRRPTRKVATLSATVAFTAKLLVPKAARFRAMHPEWDLRLHASDLAVDLRAGEADAAIRYGLGARPGHVSEPLLHESFAPVASPRIAPKTPSDLSAAGLIHFDWLAGGGAQVPSWRTWAEAAGLRGVDWNSGVAFNDEASAIQAAVAGQGVAMLSLALVHAELAAGLLVQPFGPAIPGWRYDFVCAEGAQDRPAVVALRRWIVEEVLAGSPSPASAYSAAIEPPS